MSDKDIQDFILRLVKDRSLTLEDIHRALIIHNSDRYVSLFKVSIVLNSLALRTLVNINTVYDPQKTCYSLAYAYQQPNNVLIQEED